MQRATSLSASQAMVWNALGPACGQGLLMWEVTCGAGELIRGETEPGDRVAAQDAPLLLVGQAWNGRHHSHRLGALAVPVRIVGGVHDHLRAHAVEHVREDLLL